MLANGGGFGYASGMTDKNTESDPQRTAKRWRKTKWSYGVIFAYLAITFAAGVWWSAHSHKKFQEAVDPIVAAGEPLAWSDLASDPVPDDQNAAILYMQIVEGTVLEDAHDILRSDQEPWSWGRHDIVGKFMAGRDVRRKHSKELRKLLGMASEAFALCRMARDLDEVDWEIDFSANPYEVDLPQFQALVEVANLLHLAMVEAHESGRDDEAVEYYLDGIALGDSLLRAPALVGYLVGVAVHAIMDSSLEEILPTMKIGDASHSVGPEKLGELTAKLLDTERFSKSLNLALMAERSVGYSTSQSILTLEILNGQFSGVPDVEVRRTAFNPNPLLRAGLDFGVAPMFRLDTAWAIKHHGAYVRTSKLGTLPECRRSLQPPLKEFQERLEGLTFARPITTLLVPSLEGAFEIHHNAIAKRRMSGTAVAVRMYQIDQGRRPEKLQDLVPKYLPKVPQDPMDEPGNSIRYIDDPDTPRLYSVGKNGLDENGVFDDLGERDTKEILVFLNRRPRTDKKESDSDDDD